MNHSTLMKRLIVCGGLVLGASCANTFSTTYKGAGPASEALNWSKQAQSRFENLAPDEDSVISKVLVFIDSVPPELTVDGTTIGVSAGSGAELLGQVYVIATLKVPSEEEAIPVLQKVAFAGGANLAYCPTEGLGHRCYLVRLPKSP